MAKSNKFSNGDYVSGKKFNGEKFIGIYVHEYDCGDHLVSDGNKEFCVRKGQCHLANEDDAEQIKETIVKPKKEREKELKKAKKEQQLSEEDMEEAVEE